MTIPEPAATIAPAPEDFLGTLRQKYGAEISPCGSRVICDPAPTDTDADFLVVLPSKKVVISDVVGELAGEGWNWEGSEHYQDCATNDFMSWRKGSANLIVTANSTFATRHKAATHLCKSLNLLSKADRIMAFQAVLYGNVVGGSST